MNALKQAAELLVGTQVSIDVSTSDDDFDRRIFATVIGFQDAGDRIDLLAEEQSRNFKLPLADAPGAVLDELRSLAARYAPDSLDAVRMARVVRYWEQTERSIDQRAADLSQELGPVARNAT